MDNYLLIEASAGTGKTEALGQRLIELLEVAHLSPQEIVALTFSRAAAGEIFERFVSLLAKRAVQDPPAAELLRKVLSTQHLSQIGTLDSFLMRLLRAFPLELGLVGDLTLMNDYEADRMRAQVSFSILRRTESALKRTFVEAFSLAMDHQDVRSFVDSYRAFISAWHEHVAALPSPSAWGDPKTIWNEVPPFVRATEEDLARAAARIEALLTDSRWRDFAAWVRTFRGSFAHLTGYAAKLLDGAETFSGDQISFTFQRRAVNLTREETIVVREAIRAVCGYVVRQKMELARGIYKLVSAFESRYAVRIRAAGHLVFSDVPRLLAALPEESRLAIEYRTDARIRAWALDEFQDTSREQWRALVNLINEAKMSAGEKSIFLVGDSKQAIYGWRNGDVSIFARETASSFYTTRPLKTSYRSGPAIIEAVNRIFAQGRIQSEYPAWTCLEHKTAHPEWPGFVRVMEASGRVMKDFVEPVYQAAKASGSASTAILVRGNTFGEFLARELKARGLKNVVWEGESPILETPALAGFLDLIQLADHPGDRLTYRHFTMTPLAAAKYPKGVPEAAEISCEMSRAFSVQGLVRTLRALRACLPADPAVAWSVYTEERFTEMLRAAGEFELGVTPGTRLADFASFLESKRTRTVAAAGKITIMTIHRSKGLGFDSVILPLYEPKSLGTASDAPLIGDNWILPAMDARVTRVVGGLEAADRLRRDRAEQEALCTYYVAVTRAKRGLTMILHPAGDELRFSDLVRSAKLEDLTNADFAFEAKKSMPTVHQPGEELLAPAVRAPRVHWMRRLPSLGLEDGLSAGSLFADAARKARLKKGQEAHARMEAIEFSDDLPKPEGFVELWRERSFEVCVAGEWISGRFDRVVFFRRNGELFAEIVDFKSSLDHPERYTTQLETYRRAVAALTSLPLTHITARLQQV